MSGDRALLARTLWLDKPLAQAHVLDRRNLIDGRASETYWHRA